MLPTNHHNHHYISILYYCQWFNMHLYLDGKSSDSSGSGLVWSGLCSVFWKYSVISAAPLHRQTPHTHICILLKIGSNWKYNKQKSLAETKQKQSRYHSYINQLEKLEAAKAAWLVCLSLLSLTGSFLVLLGPSGLIFSDLTRLSLALLGLT